MTKYILDFVSVDLKLLTSQIWVFRNTYHGYRVQKTQMFLRNTQISDENIFFSTLIICLHPFLPHFLSLSPSLPKLTLRCTGRGWKSTGSDYTRNVRPTALLWTRPCPRAPTPDRRFRAHVPPRSIVGSRAAGACWCWPDVRCRITARSSSVCWIPERNRRKIKNDGTSRSGSRDLMLHL